MASLLTANKKDVFYIVNFKKCRDCKHWHYKPRKTCNGYIVKDNTIWRDTNPVGCLCQECIPADNLEYLEWLYNKKEKVS